MHVKKIVGRYKAVIRTISGVYSSEYKSDEDFNEARHWLPVLQKKRASAPDNDRENGPGWS